MSELTHFFLIVELKYLLNSRSIIIKTVVKY